MVSASERLTALLAAPCSLVSIAEENPSDVMSPHTSEPNLSSDRSDTVATTKHEEHPEPPALRMSARNRSAPEDAGAVVECAVLLVAVWSRAAATMLSAITAIAMIAVM